MKIIEQDDKNHGHICKDFYDVSKNYEDGLMCIVCHNILSRKWMEEHNINFKIVKHGDNRMNELNKVVDKVLESLKEKKNIKITKHNDLGMETVLFELLPDNYEQLVKNGRQQGKTEHAIIEELLKIEKEAYNEGYNDRCSYCYNEKYRL